MSKDSKIIERIRKDCGHRLALLGHHYQSDEVIRHMDLTGDSLELARKIQGLDAEYIVFCGVYFMAETAAILAQDEQKVLLPAADASCVMADTAPAAYVRGVLERLAAKGRRIVPLAYVNSQAAIKAICGEYGGTVCTSANARLMLDWAMNQGDGVLFLPDRNLAWNTADALSIPEGKRHLLDIRGQGASMDMDTAARADLLIWPGTCPIHQRYGYKSGLIEDIRSREPEAKIIVHPESPPRIVQMADEAGSTSVIINYCDEAPPGSIIYVGTEENLVARLAERHRREKTIRPLYPTYCSNMAKTTEKLVAEQLASLDIQPRIAVGEDIAAPARKALNTMLGVSA